MNMGFSPLLGLDAAVLDARLARTADLELTLGPTAEFSDYNSALSEAARIRVGFKDRGARIALVAQPGFIVDRPTYIVQENFSYVTFEMAPGMTSIPVIREAFTEDNPFPGGGNNWRFGARPMFAAMRGAAFPYLAALYDYDNTGDGWGTVGLLLHENSMGVVGRGGGFKNVGWRGIYCDASILYGREVEVSGCGKALRSSDGTAGPTESAGPEGTAGAVRLSNGSRALLRQVKGTGCRDGLYASDSDAAVSDADFSDCTNIGVAAQAKARIWGGGVKADRCGRLVSGSPIGSGYRVSDGGDIVLGQSSLDDTVYPSAIDCIGKAVAADGGSFRSNKGAFSSLNDRAVDILKASDVRMPGSTIRSYAGRAVNVAEGSDFKAQGATIQGADNSDWAIRFFNGSTGNVSLAKIQGYSGDVQVNNGDEVVITGATRLDGSTEILTNLNPGEVSTLGAFKGVDKRVRVVSAAASLALDTRSRPIQLVRGALAGVVRFALFDTTSVPWKQIDICHQATGANVEIYTDATYTTLVRTLTPGQTYKLVANGSGGFY